MREAYRLHKNALQKEGMNVNLFFIYTGKEIPDFELMKTKIADAVSKLARQVP